MKRLLLVGGGHAHLFVLEGLARRPIPGLEATLVSPVRLAPYSGMMPGVIAGHYAYGEACVDLEPLARAAGCALRHGRVAALDLARRQAQLDDGEALDYDLCSLDIGSAPDTAALPGARQWTVPVKPIEGFIHRWNQALAAPRSAALRVAVVGGGAAGFEVLLAMRHRLCATAPECAAEFHLIVGERQVLAGFPDAARRAAARALAARGVKLHAGEPAAEILPGGVRLAGGTRIDADFVLLATGAAAAAWPGAAGLATDGRGFVLVDRRLRSRSHPDIFAAGDIATVEAALRPKAGVWAVRAGPVLEVNLRAALTGGRPVEWQPQRHALALLAEGERRAIAVWGPLAAEGSWLWRWKDGIDRRFIGRFSYR